MSRHTLSITMGTLPKERWRATRRNLAIAQAALQVDEAHRLAEA